MKGAGDEARPVEVGLRPTPRKGAAAPLTRALGIVILKSSTSAQTTKWGFQRGSHRACVPDPLWPPEAITLLGNFKINLFIRPLWAKKKRPGGLVHSFRCWPGQSRRHVPLRHACCVVMAFAGPIRRSGCAAVRREPEQRWRGKSFPRRNTCRVRVLLSIYLPACLGKEKASTFPRGQA